MLFIYLYRTNFACFFVFLIYHNLYFEYTQCNKAVKELKHFIFESYYRQTGFTRENSYCLMKCRKKQDLVLSATKSIKIPDASNAKEGSKSFLLRDQR